MPSPGFCDLCVDPRDADPQVLRKILERLYKLGYETVAINQTVDEAIFDNEKKKKKKGDNETVKSPVPDPLDVADLRAEFHNKLSILNRITFAFGDTTKIHTLGQSPILRKYDLYGVVPKTQAAFQFACAQLTTDIITIKSLYPAMKFSRKLYSQAVERGIHFEIRYTDVIKPETRQHALHYSHLLHIFGKSKNVVVTSGATNQTLLRNPYDIVNLASLFGLCEVKAKAAILSQCRQLLLRAEGRRYGKGIFTIHTDRKREPKKHDREDVSAQGYLRLIQRGNARKRDCVVQITDPKRIKL